MEHNATLELTHVRLLVDEYPACVRFYRDVLGFELTWGDAESGYADFDTGETTIALFDRTAMANAIDADPQPTGGADTVAVIFRVPSVDRVHAALRDAVDFETEPHDQPGWGIRVAHFRDPSGTLLEINEPLEAA